MRISSHRMSETVFSGELHGPIALNISDVVRILSERVKQGEGRFTGEYYRHVSIETKDSLIVITLTADRPERLRSLLGDET